VHHCSRGVRAQLGAKSEITCAWVFVSGRTPESCAGDLRNAWDSHLPRAHPARPVRSAAVGRESHGRREARSKCRGVHPTVWVRAMKTKHR
jgi:hypothetical protein